MKKELEDYTFEELQEHFALKAHSGLLKAGGEGLKDSMFLIIDQTIRWHMAQEKKASKGRKK